jgi:hypothetical protein
MLMIFGHAAREALPVEEPLNWRSFERLRFLDKGGHNFIGWRHTYLRKEQWRARNDYPRLLSFAE